MELIRVLRMSRSFRIVWLGLLLSRMGDLVSLIAMAWLTLQIAGPSQFGVVVVCTTLPRMFASPIAGALLDRYEPRNLLIIDNLMRGLAILLLPALVTADAVRVWHLLVVSLAMACLSSITEVGENLVVPAILPDSQFESGNALLSLNWQVAGLAGAAIGGLTIDLVGLCWAFIVDAGTFFLMAGSTLVLPVMRGRRQTMVTDHDGDRSFLTGVRLLVRLKVTRTLTFITVGYLILCGAMEVLLPAYGRFDLQTSAGGVGLLLGVAGLGGIIGVLATSLVRRLGPRTAVAVLMGGSGVAAIPLMWTRGLALAVPVVFLVFLVSGPYFPLERSIVQRDIPPAARGRVFGARNSLRALGYPAGAASGGIAATTAGAPAAFLAVAAGFVTLGFLAVTSNALGPMRPARELVGAAGAAAIDLQLGGGHARSNTDRLGE